MDENVQVERLCPDCKVALECIKSNFSIFDQPNSIFRDSVVIDIYACPRCGLIRLYDAAQPQTRERSALQAQLDQERAQARREAELKGTPSTGDPWEKKKGGLFGLFGDGD